MAKKRFNLSPSEFKSPTGIGNGNYLRNINYQISDENNIFVGYIGSICIENTSCTTPCCIERNKINPIVDNLIALYSFDYGNGQIIEDESGNFNNAYLGSGGLIEISDPSWSDHGILITSASQFISIDNADSEFAVKSTGSSVVLGCLLMPGSFPHDIYTDDSRTNLRFSREGSSGSNLTIHMNGSDLLTASGFFSSGAAFSGIIGITISENSCLVYKNGYLFASGGHAIGLASAFTNDMFLGASGNSFNIGSELYQCAIYSDALSASEHLYMSSSISEVFTNRNLRQFG